MKKKVTVSAVVVVVLAAVALGVFLLLKGRKPVSQAEPPVPFVSEIISDNN